MTKAERKECQKQVELINSYLKTREEIDNLPDGNNKILRQQVIQIMHPSVKNSVKKLQNLLS